MVLCLKTWESRSSPYDLWYYLTLLPEESAQRTHALREVFNGLRYIVKTGAPWRWMPNDLPPWEIVYQQAQRWLKAGCFETSG